MKIETNRLVIQNLTRDDTRNLYHILSDTEVMKYIEPPFDYNKTVTFIKTYALCNPPQIYGIFLKQNGLLIGHLIFHPFNEKAYELGWVIARQYWNNGYAQELTKGIITYSKKYRIPKLVLECDRQQIVTKHIAEKHGFKHVRDEDNLSVFELDLEVLDLSVPKLEDLRYRQHILADPETMSYNKGYDLAFEGYHKDTGCIDFPQSEWQEWYSYFIEKEPERFYAYIVRKEDNINIGEVNLHKSCEEYYDMGIVIEAKHRGNGYAKEALKLLLQYAFETLNINAIHNDFEEERSAALKIHLDCGFKIIKKENGIIHLMMTAEDYYKNRLNRGLLE